MNKSVFITDRQLFIEGVLVSADVRDFNYESNKLTVTLSASNKEDISESLSILKELCIHGFEVKTWGDLREIKVEFYTDRLHRLSQLCR